MVASRRLQIVTSNFVHELATRSISLVVAYCPPGPQVGVARRGTFDPTGAMRRPYVSKQTLAKDGGSARDGDDNKTDRRLDKDEDPDHAVCRAMRFARRFVNVVQFTEA